MRRRFARLDIAVGLVALIYTGLVAALCVVHFPGQTLWNGYYTLLVHDGSRPGSFDRRLAAAGFRFLSPESVRVSFTDFERPASVSIAELPDRLDPLDPRFDPYLHGVERYFRLGGEQIRYLEADRSLIAIEARLSGALRGFSWRLADVSTSRSALCLAALFAGSALFMVRNPRRGVLYLLGVLPWIPVVLPGARAAILALTLYVAWGLATEGLLSAALDASAHGMLEALEARRKWAAAGGLALAAATQTADPSWRIVLPAAAADCVLWGAALALLARRRLQAVHRLFVPLALLSNRGSRRSSEARGVAMLALAVLLAATQVGFALGSRTAQGVPSPQPVSGVISWTWSSLVRLSRDHPADRLPDVTDFLAHRAYQAALAYGRAYRFPLPDEKVMVPAYEKQGDRIVEHNRTVMQFTHAWFHEQLGTAAGIARMFVMQPRPTVTVLEPAAPGPLAETRFLLYPLLCLGAFLPFALSRGVAVRGRAMKRCLGLRRRQQAA